ncbi:MAG: hypothetical protein A3G34_08175 [Candidatus Lindowbacteria bacterium RIFCSPLOWO2_12_FULL_62_27]|nr:MAG: hypothetical protein A3G34_08175 [Candidatus Lindowbacteria bacterium RIFCSPLOWO2_12_FULL_62_27]
MTVRILVSLCLFSGWLSVARADTGWIRPTSLVGRFVSYVHSDPLSDGSGLAEGHLNMEGRKPLSPGLEAFVSAEIWGDNRSLSAAHLNQVHDRAVRRPAVNAVEAYLDFRADRWDLRIGKQKISWGRAEGMNPTDVFGAFDYADLLDPARLGIVALRAFVYPDRAQPDHCLELIFRPLYSPSRAGRSNTRWRPLLDGGRIGASGAPSAGVSDAGLPAVGVDVVYPATAFSNADYGAKLSRPWSEWDVSVSYARVTDDLAGGERLGGLWVRPLFLKKRMAGLDAVRTLGEGRWEAHVEAAYTSTPAGTDDDVLQVVAGGRRAVTDIYRGVDLDLTIEWAGEHVYSYRRDPGPLIQNLTQRPFPGSVLVESRWDLTEFSSWTVRGAYTFRGADAWVATAEYAWRVTDLLELRAGFDALSGKGSRGVQATYEENDRWRLESTIFFR